MAGCDFVPVPRSARPAHNTAALIGALAPDRAVQLTFLLRQRHGSPRLPGLGYWQNVPLGRRKYLSVQEFAAIYGASQADADALVEYVTTHGFNVLDINLGRRAVRVTGTAAQVKAALNVSLNEYTVQVPVRTRASAEPAMETRTHRGFEGSAHLPAAIAPLVDTVVGLDNRRLGGPNAVNPLPKDTKPLSVPELAQLYNFPKIDATGQTRSEERRVGKEC